MNRPLWNRAEDPGLVLRYVEANTAATLLSSLPPRTEGFGLGALERVRAVFEGFARAGIRYADESVVGQDGWQEIRGPTEVLKSPRLANCVDLAVTFSGACLDAGVHPLIILLDPVAGGPAHAMVVAWVAGSWSGVGGDPGYEDFAPGNGPEVLWPRGMRQEVDGAGAFLPIEITQVTEEDPTLESAVRVGAKLLTSGNWRISLVVDVGLHYDPRGEMRAQARHVSGIHTHIEEVNFLEGFRRNLLAANLPFVPPADESDPVHPRRLLDRLAMDAGLPGVLLVGAAGVGKTRTCFEVAAQAVQAGWAVLHVTAGETAVTSSTLNQAIIEERADRILVVLDYLNDYRIDWLSLRNLISSDRARYGSKIAFIASCRPGWRSTGAAASLEVLFEVIELEPDAARTAAIRDQILHVMAPGAVEAVGLERMRDICGNRPVIAMLIASEAESLCARHLLEEALPRIRSADLISWLKRRLREDNLLPSPPANHFDDDVAPPGRSLQACVAMMLASPQGEASIMTCGQELADAESIFAKLKMMKWMVRGPGGWAPVHDLVADQLVEHILIDQVTNIVRGDLSDRVLETCLTSGRSVGRFALNLSRVIRDMPTGKGESFRSRCAAWLSANAERAGEVLAGGEDEGSYAIGAVLENPAWSPVAFNAWHQVVDPWLRRYKRSMSARHLFYKGFRSEVGKTDPRLVPEALAWLSEHDTTVEAGFVLGPLLGRDLDV
ncbi:hypothetical protein, partial [Amycolatopsis pretoriensis]